MINKFLYYYLLFENMILYEYYSATNTAGAVMLARDFCVRLKIEKLLLNGLSNV